MFDDALHSCALYHILGREKAFGPWNEGSLPCTQRRLYAPEAGRRYASPQIDVSLSRVSNVGTADNCAQVQKYGTCVCGLK